MITAFVRLLLISIAVSIGCFLVIFALRYIGLATPYGEPHIPFQHAEPWKIALGGDPDQGPASSLEAFQSAFEKGWILGADLQLTQDEHWVVYGGDTLDTQTEGEGLVSFQTLEQFKKLNLGQKNTQFQGKRFEPLTLDEFIKAFPTASFLFNIHVRYPEKMKALADVLDSHKLKDRMIFQSPFATALREMRKYLSNWVYGLDPSSVARFLFMKSIYLETFADLKAEVFIAPVEMEGLWVFDEKVLAELKRRHKKIIPIVNQSDEKIKSLLHESSGYMTTHPNLLQ